MYKRSTLLQNGDFYYLPLAWCSDFTSAFIACGHKGIAYTSKPIFFTEVINLTYQIQGVLN